MNEHPLSPEEQARDSQLRVALLDKLERHEAYLAALRMQPDVMEVAFKILAVNQSAASRQMDIVVLKACEALGTAMALAQLRLLLAGKLRCTAPLSERPAEFCSPLLMEKCRACEQAASNGKRDSAQPSSATRNFAQLFQDTGVKQPEEPKPEPEANDGDQRTGTSADAE
jgi:hypothetical protein